MRIVGKLKHLGYTQARKKHFKEERVWTKILKKGEIEVILGPEIKRNREFIFTVYTDSSTIDPVRFSCIDPVEGDIRATDLLIYSM